MISMKISGMVAGIAFAVRMLTTLMCAYLSATHTEWGKAIWQNFGVYYGQPGGPDAMWKVYSPSYWVPSVVTTTAADNLLKEGILSTITAWFHALALFAFIAGIVMCILAVVAPKKEAAPVEADSETSGEE